MSEIRSQRSENSDQSLGRGSRRPPVLATYVLLSSVLCLLSSVLCPPVHADAPLKIGYVNLRKVVDGYQRKQESEQTWEQKGKQKQAELEGRLNELKKLRQSVELLNDQAREAKSREIEEKADELKRLKERSDRDLLRERNELVKQILDEIGQAVADYAKANGYSVILDQGALLYGEEAYDVTDEVLKALNARYAAKGGKH